jgi:hypothetical protein
MTPRARAPASRNCILLLNDAELERSHRCQDVKKQEVTVEIGIRRLPPSAVISNAFPGKVTARFKYSRGPTERLLMDQSNPADLDCRPVPLGGAVRSPCCPRTQFAVNQGELLS